MPDMPSPEKGLPGWVKPVAGAAAAATLAAGIGIAATRGEPTQTQTPATERPSAAASPTPEKTPVPTVTVTKSPEPTPTLKPIDTIIQSNPEPVTYQTLEEDLKKAFEDPLVQTIPQANATKALQDCKSAQRIAERKSACSLLIERFFRFYNANGNTNSFKLSFDVYSFAIGPEGPYYNNRPELDAEIKAHSS